MQAFFWLAVRALTKLGMAMAASRPIMATTIMISTSVKPALRRLLVFIILFRLLQSRRELKRKAGQFMSAACRSQIALRGSQASLRCGYAKGHGASRKAAGHRFIYSGLSSGMLD